jgi:hypothetical protein
MAKRKAKTQSGEEIEVDVDETADIDHLRRDVTELKESNQWLRTKMTETEQTQKDLKATLETGLAAVDTSIQKLRGTGSNQSGKPNPENPEVELETPLNPAENPPKPNADAVDPPEAEIKPNQPAKPKRRFL